MARQAKSRIIRPVEKMTPKGQRTRLALLDAAIGAFAEHGYDSVSIKDIAALAGVTAASIYRYYEDKEQLYQAASVRTVSRTTERILEAVRRQESPAEKLRAFIGALADVILDDHENTRLFERHLISAEIQVLTETVKVAFEEPFAVLLDLLNAVSSRPRSEKDAAAIFALTLGMAQFSMLLDTSASSKISLHHDSRALSAFVIETLVPEIDAGGSAPA